MPRDRGVFMISLVGAAVFMVRGAGCPPRGSTGVLFLPSHQMKGPLRRSFGKLGCAAVGQGDGHLVPWASDLLMGP